MSAHDGLTTGTVPVGGTRLVVDPADPVVLTLRRDTDARTAITRGIKEYIEQLSIAFAGRTMRFKSVKYAWPDPEVDALYPSATIYTEGEGSYDPARFTPIVSSGTQVDGTNVFLGQSCEYVTMVTIEVWCTEEVERRALIAMLEDALSPVDWMYGCRLRLPHYHGAFCTIEPKSCSYLEDDRDAQRRLRKFKMQLDCHVPMLRAFSNLSIASPDKIRISYTVTVGPPEVPTGLPGPDGGPGFAPPGDC